MYGSKQELASIKVKYLGKKGELTLILKTMANLSEEERPIVGSLVNSVRKELEQLFKNKEEELNIIELNKKLEDEKIDISLPSSKQIRGTKHPMNMVIEEVEDLFVSMGYDVVEGPELRQMNIVLKN